MEIAHRTSIQTARNADPAAQSAPENPYVAHGSNAEAEAKIAQVAADAPDHQSGEALAAQSNQLSQKASIVAAAYGGPVAVAAFGAGWASGEVGSAWAAHLHADDWVADQVDSLARRFDPRDKPLHRLAVIGPQGPNPARVGDPIAHSMAATGMLATVLLAVAASVAVGLAIAATGGVAAVALIGAAAAGGLTGGFLGVALGGGMAKVGTVTGAILKGSTDVFIEKLGAARMTDPGQCSKDPGTVPLVEGSETVFINGLPLARVGHKLLCGAVVDKGAGSVFTDHSTQACAMPAPEIPVWGRIAMDWIGFLPLGKGIAAASRYTRRTISRLRVGNRCVSKCTKVGEPVDVGSGEFYEYRLDLNVDGSLPLRCERHYSSGHLARNPSLLGPGFADSFSVCLRREASGNLVYWDEQGQGLVFHTPDPFLQAGHLLAPELLLCGTQQTPRLLDLQSGLCRHFAWQGEVARLVQVSDANGNAYTLHYSEQHLWQHSRRLVEIRHSDGYTLHLAWEDAPPQSIPALPACATRVRWLLQEAGEVHEILRQEFDQQQRLIRSASDSGGHLCYAWYPDRPEQGQASGRLATWWDSAATRVRLHYDAQGRISNVDTPGHLLATRISYTPSADGGLVTRVYMRDSQGRELPPTEYHNNAQGLLIRTRNPLGQESLQEWDADEQLLASRDVRGHWQRYRYNHLGQLIQILEGEIAGAGDLSRITDLEYDPRARLAQARCRGQGWQHAQRWEYGVGEQEHLLLRIEQSWQQSWQKQGSPSCRAQTRFEWHARGMLAALETDGRRTEFAYDGRCLPCARMLPNGAREEWQQNRLGRMYWLRDALGQETRFTYATLDPGFGPVKDAQRRPQQVKLANGDSLRFHYDAEGRLCEEYDATGARRSYEWGPFDLLLAQTDAHGQPTRYLYDHEARLAQVCNARAQHWTYERDAAGQLQAETDFNGRRTTYTYDQAGRIVRKLQAGQLETCYTWDHAQEQITEMRSGGISLRFTWDRQGRLQQASRWRGQECEAENHFQYNSAGQILQDAQTHGKVAWEYAANGQLQAWQIDQGHAQHRQRCTWDSMGYLQSLHLRAGDIYLQRDVLGQETGRANLNLFGQTCQNQDKLLQAQTLAPHFHLRQFFDPLGQLRSQQLQGEHFAGGIAHTNLRRYHWKQGQLRQIDDARFGQVNHEWDTRGQIRSTTYQNGGAEGGTGRVEHFSYAQDGALHEVDNIVTGGQWQHQYDAAGRLLEKVEMRKGFRARRWRYEWDGFDRLLAVHNADGESWEYRYDAFGRRISKQRLQGKASRRHLLRETCIWDGARLVRQHKTWHDQSLPEEHARRTESYTWHYEGDSFKPLAVVHQRNQEREELYNLITDQIGSLKEAVNQQGQVVWAAQSATWGALRQEWQDWREIALPHLLAGAANDTWLQPELRQVNQWQDVESGLFYNYQRYYDPERGQYLSADPLGLAGGMHSHGYVENPLTWCDPLGLSGCGEGGAKPRTTSQLVQEIAKRADAWGTRRGLGNGPIAGTKKHGYADALLTRYQRMYGDLGLSTEVRYTNGRLWQPGDPLKGSVRLDVVEGPPSNPTAVYDYKFGAAQLSPTRVAQIQRVAGINSNIPITGVKP